MDTIELKIYDTKFQ